MKNTPDVMGNGGDDRFAGQSGTYRGNQRRDLRMLPEQSGELPAGPPPLESVADMPTMLEPPPVRPPSVSINDLDPLPPSTFPVTGWLDDSPTGTMADHPLLRGLLMELPPKGSVPPPEWLDRWFGAARSILDLLYAHHAHRPSPR